MYKKLVNLSFTFLVLGAITGVLWFYSGYGSAQVVPTRIVVATQPGQAVLSLFSQVLICQNRVSLDIGIQ